MPTIILVQQFRLYFYSNEPERAHIHVLHIGLGVETIIWLDDLSIKRSSGSRKIDREALRLAARYQEECQNGWNQHFGVNNEE